MATSGERQGRIAAAILSEGCTPLPVRIQPGDAIERFAEASLHWCKDHISGRPLEEGVFEMACDRAQERVLRLSQGLFGAPAGQADRDRAAGAAERRVLEACRAR